MIPVQSRNIVELDFTRLLNRTVVSSHQSNHSISNRFQYPLVNELANMPGDWLSFLQLSEMNPRIINTIPRQPTKRTTNAMVQSSKGSATSFGINSFGRPILRHYGCRQSVSGDAMDQMR